MKKLNVLAFVCFILAIVHSLYNVTNAIIKGNVYLVIVSFITCICAIGGCFIALGESNK